MRDFSIVYLDGGGHQIEKEVKADDMKKAITDYLETISTPTQTFKCVDITKPPIEDTTENN